MEVSVIFTIKKTQETFCNTENSPGGQLGLGTWVC